jgi:hypothetical protein
MGFVAPWSKAVCPFCFEHFHLSAAASRAVSPDGKKEPDSHVGTFLSVPPPEMGRVEPASSSLLRKLFVPNDWKGQTRKICPKCHLFLPHATATGQLSSEIIAIIGARSSGKSNFFGVLLNALERRYASEVGFTIQDQDTFSMTEMRPISSKQLYRERYGRRLYESADAMAIDQNRSAAQDRFLRIPLIYRLQFSKRWRDYLAQPFGTTRSMDLVIFDAAGEDMEDPVMLEQFYSYLLGAVGVIFIIDPFQYPGIRSRLSPDLLRRFPKIPVDPAEVVSRVIGLFERRAGIRVGGKVPVPVAFAFAKSDLLKGIVDPSSPILKDSRHTGGFNVADCQRVSDEVIEYVRECDSPQLVDLAKHKFRSYSFFALSALGQLPDEQLRIQRPDPMRVADPLLWLLWQRGYIPSAPPSQRGRAQ